MTKLSPAAQAVLTKLSPAAQAVLTEITQQEYCLDPAEIPLEACRMAYIASAALRAAADQVERKWRGFAHEACQELRAIAAELEGNR